MKKLLFIVVAVLCTLISCSDSEPESKIDNISVFPENKVISKDGGNVTVIVTSSGNWTLNSKEDIEYDWVKVDKFSGKDGEEVTFSVSPNDKEEKKAEFVFITGTSQAVFKLTSLPNELPTIKVVSDNPVTVNHQKGTLQVLLEFDKINSYRDIKSEVTSENQWLKYDIILDGDNLNAAKVNFNYDSNETLEQRSAKVTFSSENVEPVTLDVVQLAKPTLEVEKSEYTLGLDEGILQIKVNTNIEYEVSLSNGADWLTNHTTEGNIEKWNYGKLESGRREAIITFTEKNPAEGVQPLSVSVPVRQGAIIGKVAYMVNHRARLDRESGNLDALKVGKNYTVELLLKHDGNFDGEEGGIVGVFNNFIIRYDSFNVPENMRPGGIEVLFANEYGEAGNMVLPATKIPAGEWMHLAITVGDGVMKAYKDGEMVAMIDVPNIRDLDFAEIKDLGYKQCEFYVGQGFEHYNDFDGQMSEIRIWNKTLSDDEINSNNHFYTVPTDSEGLVAYWKMNDGDGSIIKDYTANGNNLIGEKYTKEGDETKWIPNMEWNDVSLPE